MKKTLLFLPLLIMSFIIVGQEIQFSHNKYKYSESFELSLSNENLNPIYYSLDGSKPSPGQNGTSSYNNPIPIAQPITDFSIFNQIENYGGDSNLTFFPQFQEYDFTITPQTDRDVIVRACSLCNGTDESIRIYHISNTSSEIENKIFFVFDTPQEWWDTINGHAARTGFSFPIEDHPILSQLGIPEIHMANYEAGNGESLFGALMPEVWDTLPHNWMHVDAYSVVYEKNTFLGVFHGELRNNGGSSKHYPIPGMKFSSDEQLNTPYGQTKNFYIRSYFEGISNTLENELAFLNQEKYLNYLPIAKNSVHASVGMHTNGLIEGFGAFSIMESPDKKFVRNYFKIDNPTMVRAVPAIFGPFVVKGNQEDSLVFANFIDSLEMNILSKEELERRVYIKEILQVGLVKIIGNCRDAFSNNMVVAFEKENGIATKIAPVLKDGDGILDPSHLESNYLGFALTGNTDYGSAGFFNQQDSLDVSNFFQTLLRAALYHYEDSIYYQNILIDLSENYRLEKTTAIFENVENNFWKDYSKRSSIDSLNGYLDSLSFVNKFAQQKTLLPLIREDFIEDWMKIFHPDAVSLQDTFSITVNMEDIPFSQNCQQKGGTVRLNSLYFSETGSRIGISNFDLEVQAIPIPGWIFSHWEEYPNENANFILNHSGSDITLTPVFTQEQDVCSGRGSLQITEVYPQDAEQGADFFELYNSDQNTITLKDIHIGDGAIPKYTFSDIRLAPGEYHSVSCDSLGFGLKAGGEALYLFDRDSVVQDSFSWTNALPNANSSYSRCENDWILVDSVTIGYQNYCQTSSIIDSPQNDIHLYPNPAMNVLNIQGVHDNFDYQIFDMMKKKYQFGKSDGQINIRKLPQGFYVLLINSDNKFFTIEFIKI